MSPWEWTSSLLQWRVNPPGLQWRDSQVRWRKNKKIILEGRRKEDSCFGRKKKRRSRPKWWRRRGNQKRHQSLIQASRWTSVEGMRRNYQRLQFNTKERRSHNSSQERDRTQWVRETNSHTTCMRELPAVDVRSSRDVFSVHMNLRILFFETCFVVNPSSSWNFSFLSWILTESECLMPVSSFPLFLSCLLVRIMFLRSLVIGQTAETTRAAAVEKQSWHKRIKGEGEKIALFDRDKKVIQRLPLSSYHYIQDMTWKQTQRDKDLLISDLLMWGLRQVIEATNMVLLCVCHLFFDIQNKEWNWCSKLGDSVVLFRSLSVQE